ncbi:GNAT family N-acetyltransferase [Georgenia sp. SYP-B2076]|uniref:GNAT family N-acetyltransferase n=1 Tax=Georgenia sp. SYP-B2076 TaxID=2495881 RepID=UPI0013DFF902|nr:GNAT family N-acetyltransferase [Georgenia sp. SYP-B2076]
MTTFRIAELAVPTDPGASPSWAAEGWAEVGAEHLIAVLGHDDFIDPPRTRVADYADQKHSAKVVLLAVRGHDGADVLPATVDGQGAGAEAAHEGAGAETTRGAVADVVGFAGITMPRTDNTHLAMVDLMVRPGARRRGVGEALWRAAEERVRAAGREVVTTWSSHVHEPPAGHAAAVVAATGVGAISADDPSARFALAHGFALEQTDRHSMLALPVDPAALAGWRAQAAQAAGEDYRVVQWADRTPEELLDGVAVLQRRMSTDAPSAGVDLREEVWDAQRVRDTDEAITRTGDRYVLTAALHVPTGELAAFTQLMLPAHRKEMVFQYNTLVRADHRGRRLGLLVKAANLQLLAQVRPEARRVHTWNAGENRYMLAINEQIGFARASIEGAWQRRLG